MRRKKSQSGTSAGKPLPDPTERERREGMESARRIRARRRRVQVGPDIGSPHNDRSLWTAQLVDAFGTSSTAFCNRMVNQLANGMRRESETHDHGTNAGLAVVASLKPENEIEAMLAVQMAATHDAAMSMLATAKNASMIPTIDSCGALATKLLRTYAVQVEALAKLRRGGEQKVTVEHVHVYPGGQAIVGNVQHPGGGVAQKSEEQAHGAAEPRAPVHSPSAPLWSEEPGREPVPASGGEGQDAMHDARRGTGQRRAEG